MILYINLLGDYNRWWISDMIIMCNSYSICINTTLHYFLLEIRCFILILELHTRNFNKYFFLHFFIKYLCINKANVFISIP